MKNKEKIIREFIKAFINRVGINNTKIILSHIDNKVVMGAIKSGFAKGLNIEQIVGLFVNFSFPPKITLTFELFGDFNELDEVKRAVIQTLDQISRIKNVEMIDATINSFVPYIYDKLALGHIDDQESGEENGEALADNFMDYDTWNIDKEDDIDNDQDNWVERWTKKFNE